MPPHNRFHHQDYAEGPPTAPYELVVPDPPVAPETAAFHAAMQSAAEQLVAAGVSAVYLLHGTFAGTDSLGWIGELERAIPALARGLRRQHKRMVDSLTGDQGNYVEEYRATFEKYLTEAAHKPIPVRLFHWSSQNHHCGRAEAAVSLVDTLLNQQFNDDARVLLWGHSHAGNVLALFTNLLGADLVTRREFFLATRPYADRIANPAVRAVWARVHAILDKPGNPLQSLALDICTFGTPIRYGWDTLGYDHLTHFVNHAPQRGLPPYQARFPSTLDELRAAAGGQYGDYIQQTFVAGTNWPPPVTNWHAWQSDRLLSKLIQREQSNRDLLKRLRAGRRVPDEGTTLLVDYARADLESARAMSGHGVYTKLSWLPFHATQVAQRYVHPFSKRGASARNT